jgi:hypothetical protein
MPPGGPSNDDSNAHHLHHQHDENTSLLSSLEDGSHAKTKKQQQQSSRRSHSNSNRNNNNNHHHHHYHRHNRHKSSKSRSPNSTTLLLSTQPYKNLTPPPPFSIRRALELCAIAALLVGCSLAAGMMWAKYRPATTAATVTATASKMVVPPPLPLQQQQQQQQQQSLHKAYYEPPSSADNYVQPKYQQAQFFGFQIYTGGAPAFIPQDDDDDGKEDDTNNNNTNTNTTTAKQLLVPNPECKNMRYGEVILETDPELMCYLGHHDPLPDVQHRMAIMRDAVEQAYQHADHDSHTLKVFVAPEFYWRGRKQGAYQFVSLDKVFSDQCRGPICAILSGLEDIVEDKRFQDWFFLFGTIVATQELPSEKEYQHLFYNFAPIYKGFDPTTTATMTTTTDDNPSPPPSPPRGKRFLLPKRYVSDSDFLRNVNFDKNADFKRGWKELLGQQNQPQQQQKQNDPLYQPHLRYDDHLFEEYKLALQDDAGYSMIEYDWLQIDGITMTLGELLGRLNNTITCERACLCVFNTLVLLTPLSPLHLHSIPSFYTRTTTTRRRRQKSALII